MKRSALWLVWLVGTAASVSLAAGAAPPQPDARAGGQSKIHVLILSGANNHDWKTTTPALKEVLEGTGRFAVEVTNSPGEMTAGSLEPFDVIVSNWNTFTSRTAPPREANWPAAAREALIGFVRNGKGHVGVHAGTASFYDWPEYHQLALGTFKIGQTSHGKYHPFDVELVGDHPIVSGMSRFTTTDELYHGTAFQEGVTVLAKAFSSKESGGSGKEEPVAVAGSFGKGRSVYVSLGHDAKAIRNSGFGALLARGVEWAATGKVAEAQAAPAGALRWERGAGEAPSLALMHGERLVWRFNYDAKVGKPCFELAPVGGPEITALSPPDHPWHYGLWFSWKLINGVNYWEIDKAAGKPKGATTWKNVKGDLRPDSSATISLDLEYAPPEQPPILTERRQIEISAPAADGSYHLDWMATFAAGGQDLLLDRTPPPGQEHGVSNGGYAGLSVRMQKLEKVRAVNLAGPIEFDAAHRYRGHSEGFDYCGELGGQTVGVAILDHPSNPRSPSPWYVINDGKMCYVNAAVLCFEPMTVKAGQSFELRYRIVVHAGPLDAARLAELQGQFAGRKSR